MLMCMDVCVCVFVRVCVSERQSVCMRTCSRVTRGFNACVLVCMGVCPCGIVCCRALQFATTRWFFWPLTLRPLFLHFVCVLEHCRRIIGSGVIVESCIYAGVSL